MRISNKFKNKKYYWKDHGITKAYFYPMLIISVLMFIEDISRYNTINYFLAILGGISIISGMIFFIQNRNLRYDQKIIIYQTKEKIS